MTISSLDFGPNKYFGNGSTTAFSSTFEVISADNLKVELLLEGASASVVQTSPTDYTATVAGDNKVTATFVTAPPAGSVITLSLDVEPTQEADFTNNDEFDAEVLEDALDKLTLLIQQTKSTGTLQVSLPASAVNVDQTLPSVISGRALKWNAAGTAITNTTVDPDVTATTVAANASRLSTVEAQVQLISGAALVPPVQIELVEGQASYSLGPTWPVDQLDEKTYDVAIDGIVRYPTVDYTVEVIANEMNVTLTSAPAATGAGYRAGAIMLVRLASSQVTQDLITDGSIEQVKIAARALEILGDKFAQYPQWANRCVAFDASGQLVARHRDYIGALQYFAMPAANLEPGWLQLTGQHGVSVQNVSRTTYAELFAKLGTSWGSGDGSTTFGLPPGDLFLLGAVGAYTFGDTGGAATHTLTGDELPAITPTGTASSAGAHTHNVRVSTSGGSGSSITRESSSTQLEDRATSSAGAHTHTITLDPIGGGQAHNNMPPYMVGTLAIFTGVYP